MLAQAQSILFRRTTWLYLLLCFPLIDYVLRNILPIPVVSSLWDEALLALLVAIALWRWLETNRKLPGIKAPLLAFVAVGLGYVVFNLNHVGVNIEGFRAVYQYILALAVGFFFLDSRGDAERVLKILTAVAGLVGLYGCFQWVTAAPVPASWCDASEGACRRAFSIVQSPNVLGSYMVLMAPIAMALAIRDKSRMRYVWALIALVLLAALVFTGSRGAWLAFAGSIGLLVMLVDRRLFIAFLAAAVLAAVFVPQISSRFEHLFSAEYIEKSSNDGRIARWLNSYDLMRHEPVLGMGLGRYGGAVGQRNFGTIYVDSYYFKTLAEMGLLGLTVYLWLMAALFRSGFRIWRAERGGQFFLYGGVLAGLLGVILHNAVENIFEVPFMNTYFWLLAGLLLSLPYLREKGGEAHERT
jgi:O-antigen ligase